MEIYFLAFIFSGGVCALAQLIYDKTKLTPGHIVTLFVIMGAVLSFFNVYDDLINIFSCGATSLITNYGHLLFQGAKKGAETNNFFMIFIELMKTTSGIVSFAIVISVLAALIKRPKP